MRYLNRYQIAWFLYIGFCFVVMLPVSIPFLSLIALWSLLRIIADFIERLNNKVDYIHEFIVVKVLRKWVVFDYLKAKRREQKASSGK